MKRRDWLKLAVMGPLGGTCMAADMSARRRFRVDGREGGKAPWVRPDLLDLVDDPAETEAIARAYRRAHPRESLAEIERALRTATEPGATDAGKASGRGSLDAIRRVVRREYAEGRTLELNGWILSETEARQCVVYTSVHQSTT